MIGRPLAAIVFTSLAMQLTGALPATPDCDTRPIDDQIAQARNDHDIQRKATLLRQAIQCEESNPSPVDWAVGTYYEELGDYLVEQGHLDEAFKDYEAALGKWKAAAFGGPLTSDSARLLLKEAQILTKKNQPVDAETHLREAQKVLKDDFQEDPWITVDVAEALSKILVSSGRTQDAADVWAHAYNVVENNPNHLLDGEHTGKIYRGLLSYADVLDVLQDYHGEREKLDRGVVAARGADGFWDNLLKAAEDYTKIQPESPSLKNDIDRIRAAGVGTREAEARLARAKFLISQGEAAEAEDDLLFAASDPTVVGSLVFAEAANALGELLYSRNDQLGKAEEVTEKLINMATGITGESCPGTCGLRLNLAAVLSAEGRYADANEQLDKAELAIQSSAEAESKKLGSLFSLAVERANLYLKMNKVPDALAEIATTSAFADQLTEIQRGLLIQLKAEALAPTDPKAAISTLTQAMVGQMDDSTLVSLELALAPLEALYGSPVDGLTNAQNALKILKSLTPTEPFRIEQAELIAASILIAQWQESGEGDVTPLHQAREMLRDGQKQLTSQLEPLHPEFAKLFALLVSVDMALGDNQQALDDVRAETKLYRDRGWLLTTTKAAEFDGERDAAKLAFEQNLQIVATLSNSGTMTSDQAAREAFEVAQLLSPSHTSQALAITNASLRSNDPARRALVQALGRDRAQQFDREASLLQLLQQPESRRDRAAEAGVKGQIDRLRNQSAAAEKELLNSEGSALPAGDAISVEKVQALLNPHEAMLVYTTNDVRTIGWTIRPDRPAVMRLFPPDETKIAAAVKRLRRSLQLNAEPSSDENRPPPFDVVDAVDLYDQLVRPFQADLDGATDLLVVSTGALEALPVETLLRSKPSTSDLAALRYGDFDWLAKHFAISALPSVDALALIRGRPTTTASVPYMAIGIPDLGGPIAGRDGSGDTPILTQIGGVANRQAIYAHPPLEVKDLVTDMLGSLGLSTDSTNSLTDAAATEMAVNSLPWSSFAVVAFATHGLTNIGSDPTQQTVAEPGLILTPPAVQGVEASQDGFLTASEIANLDMINTRLAILVACSSASGDGSNRSEGFTGLVRAFFMAGARSVIAAHWNVNQSASDELLSDMLEKLHDQPGLSISHAHQAAIQSMLDMQGIFAHPYYWAPFAIVGDGATTLD
ncbi:CHAT domain-containing protein [Rhizobium ruizarguesonis]|uniref:CHAT domain-containing protein n=1 Tax=Rhizobium ruizarguesonis TaxID=2081791 RepID=UPI00103187D7|nr:CHAT domain-containing protein [Rhizobium ruizarguesonis]TAX63548.1 CHAT domain-containing protein [Rhizobium ruizarguesonis]